MTKQEALDRCIQGIQHLQTWLDQTGFHYDKEEAQERIRLLQEIKEDLWRLEGLTK